MLELLGFILIALGCFLGLVGAIGLIRLPDMYARLHAVGITDTLCSFLILSGLACHADSVNVIAKLILIFLFLLFTSPVSSYALANNAFRWGLDHGQKIHISSVKEEKEEE
ncbi:monovalent cation/H(+) antiporter subunit G [Glaciecola sp.]|jgi:multicomponent Na+:H+ antiporter subunit G|uniref:monovalent cation/H(+) antiporter subunit G n=1 Tax=Glaciecola sp. MF2-115 TaxID=3384827 RepID=UPI003988C7BE